MAQAVWTIAEAHEGTLRDVSFELLARGRQLADTLGQELVSVVISGEVNQAELQRLIAHGADRVIAVQDSWLNAFIFAVAYLAEDPSNASISRPKRTCVSELAHHFMNSHALCFVSSSSEAIIIVPLPVIKSERSM